MTNAMGRTKPIPAKELVAKLRHHARAMHRRDEKVGTGFYQDPIWLAHYMELRQLSGLKSVT